MVSHKSTDEAVLVAAGLLVSGKGKSTDILLAEIDSNAIRAVGSCIKLYHQHKARRESSPRLRELCALLERVEVITRELDSLLEDPESLVRTELMAYALAESHYDRLSSFFKKAISLGETAGGLRLIAESAQLARRVLTVAYGSGDLKRPDSGGHFEPYVEIVGSPRRALLLYCAFTFADYHGPTGVTYASKGAFQDFFMAVWKAAGEDENELNPRTLRRELRELEEPLKGMLGKPVQGLANAREAREVCLTAFIRGLRQPDAQDGADSASATARGR